MPKSNHKHSKPTLMAKKNKVVQMQSPENYIRTRARNLEIFECLYDNDWKRSGVANIVVARKHTNGNITSAVYLVDLHCLGLKFSIYFFNESERNYRERLEEPLISGDKFEKIDYTLAHNIIYAGIEFAEDFGFKPHKTFTDVTQYLLEEDTDAIELIDIECGIDGKPSYFQGPNDTKTTVSRILKQLETTAGKGNFNFSVDVDDYRELVDNTEEGIDEDHDYDEDEDFDDDEDEDFDENYDEDEGENEDENQMSYDEALVIFKENEPLLETLETDKFELFIQAMDVLFQPLTDYDSYKQYYKDISEDLEIIIVRHKMPYKALGMQIHDKIKRDKIINSLARFLDEETEDNEKIFNMLKDLKAEYGDVPIFSFLELFYITAISKEDIKEKIKQYEKQFPDYPIFKISALAQSYYSILEQNPEAEIIPIHTFFPNRYRFHIIEMQEYIMYATFIAAFGTDKSRMSAFHDVLFDFDYPDDILGFVFPIINGQKIKAIKASLGLPD